MAYATQSDLTPRRMTSDDLAELCIDDSTVDPGSAEGQGIISTVAGQILEEASGRVDNYCRGRYVTPLQVSDTVKGLTLDIAVYLLFTRRRDARVNEVVKNNYQDALALLKDIANAKASLDQQSGSPQTSTAGPMISSHDRHLAFDEHNIDGFC